MQLLTAKRWENLLQLANNHLHKPNTVHYFAFFYRGVANYKLMQFEDARYDFTQALDIMLEKEGDPFKLSQVHQKIDPQLYYNLGLANFKLQQYSRAAENFKNCIRQDPQHPFAYNNLAFLYNMN